MERSSVAALQYGSCAKYVHLIYSVCVNKSIQENHSHQRLYIYICQSRFPACEGSSRDQLIHLLFARVIESLFHTLTLTYPHHPEITYDHSLLNIPWLIGWGMNRTTIKTSHVRRISDPLGFLASSGSSGLSGLCNSCNRRFCTGGTATKSKTKKWTGDHISSPHLNQLNSRLSMTRGVEQVEYSCLNQSRARIACPNHKHCQLHMKHCWLVFFAFQLKLCYDPSYPP